MASADLEALREQLRSGAPHERDEACLEPFTYLITGPQGKNVRGVLIQCFQAWLQIEESKQVVINEVISQLHNASLLIDDIEDNSQLRRGQPCAHLVYGVPSTINCGNYVYFLALESINALACPAAMDVAIRELLSLHRGQGQELLWRENCAPPSLDEYKDMIRGKTGGLFRLAVGLMQAFSDNKTDFTELVDSMGLYFQIRDDYLNLVADVMKKSKGFAEDISEGKFSFPILHAILANPGDRRLLNILRQRTTDVNIKRHAIAYIDECGSFAATRDELEGLKDAALTEIQRLGGNARLVGLIETLHGQLADVSFGLQGVPEDAAAGDMMPPGPPALGRRVDSTS